ncbi:MAG TPA: aldo/keto reductase, partial [Pseudoclavibacter sp.]|nr:aldo/keto reductase [Pseudoclavibacter sp.]
GFLTGKYRPGATVASKRAESVKQLLADPANVSLLARLDAVAIEHRVSVPAVVLAWTRAQGPVAAPIASARIPSQLDALFESADLGLTPEELAFIAGESR